MGSSTLTHLCLKNRNINDKSEFKLKNIANYLLDSNLGKLTVEIHDIIYEIENETH